MRTSNHRFAILLACLALIGCGDDTVEPILPPTFTIVEGDGQLGPAGVPLEPFRVHIADAEGAGIDGATVFWTVESGEGLFRFYIGGEWRYTDTFMSVTGRLSPGDALAKFIPTALGETTVKAYGQRANGAGSQPLELTASAEVVGLVLDEESDWDGAWPAGVHELSIDLGTTVVWLPESSCCSHRIHSVSVPSGGTPFDGSPTGTEPSFEFEPDAPGTWKWVWEREEWDDWWGDALVADTASFEVR